MNHTPYTHIITQVSIFRKKKDFYLWIKSKIFRENSFFCTLHGRAFCVNVGETFIVNFEVSLMYVLESL